MRRRTPQTPTRGVRTGESGFTLMELVVALAIVAIMAGTIAPLAYNQVKRARKEATLIELATLNDGLVAFYEDTGRFPSEGEGLAALVVDPGVVGWQGPYLGGAHGEPVSAITRDQFGRDYVYDLDPRTTPADAADVLIASLGADGRLDARQGGTWDLEADEDDLLGLTCTAPIDREKTRDGAAEMEAIGDAARNYYEDHAAFPSDPAQIIGTYMDPGVDDEEFIDPWNTPYELLVRITGGQPPVLTVRSYGPDRRDDNGRDDDLDLDVSAIPPGRKTTLWRLTIAQTALNSQPTLVLSGSWPSDRAALGLSSTFDVDGWGRPLAINATARTVYSAGPDGNVGRVADNLPAGVGP